MQLVRAPNIRLRGWTPNRRFFTAGPHSVTGILTPSEHVFCGTKHMGLQPVSGIFFSSGQMNRRGDKGWQEQRERANLSSAINPIGARVQHSGLRHYTMRWYLQSPSVRSNTNGIDHVAHLALLYYCITAVRTRNVSPVSKRPAFLRVADAVNVSCVSSMFPSQAQKGSRASTGRHISRKVLSEHQVLD